ncbi:MAG: nucleoside kinase [Clostridia bacterium]|jgi:uridine kinase|nr:nucleoside kinase [Clostridia bacterium]
MKLVYKGDTKVEMGEHKKIVDIFKNEIENSKEEIIACKCNNKVRSLNYEPEEGEKVEFLDISTADGMRIYVRGLLLIMSKAFNKLYPDALLTVNYQLSNATFCQIDNMKTTEEMIKNVSDEMKKIIDANYDINKVVMTKEEAKKFYDKEQTIRGKLQLDNKDKDTVSLYFCEDYYNYFYGVMPISTGYTKIFDLKVYNNGFLIRYPSRKNPNKLEEYKENKKLLNTLQEYEDIHRVLGINTIYKLNKEILNGNEKELILLAEALHEKKISDIADKIVNKNDVKVVLIAGPSSSGKTTFAKRLGLQLRLNGLKPVTISVDNYFVERTETPLDENGNYNFECLEAIDLKLFNHDLIELLKGNEILMPTFNFKTGHKEYTGETMKLGKDEILVIEGIHCLNDELTSAIPRENKYKIYISNLTVLNIDYFNRISTTDSRLIRRIVRDYKFRSYNAIHTLQIWNSVNRGEEQYIYPFQEEADSMFNTSLIYEFCVLKKFAVPLLESINSSYAEYSEARRLLEFLKYFETIDIENVPKNSLLREFIGDSIFEY